MNNCLYFHVIHPTKKLTAIRRWYAYMLAEDKLDVRYKPAG